MSPSSSALNSTSIAQACSGVAVPGRSGKPWLWLVPQQAPDPFHPLLPRGTAHRTGQIWRMVLPGVLDVKCGRLAVIPASGTLQGMARARSGQALAWPLVSGRRGTAGH